MGIILGLAAALLYGSSDFSGGVASRTLGFLRVSLVTSAVATVLAGIVLAGVALAGVALIGPGVQEPSLRAVAWGLAAGLGEGIGSLALFRGLARGQMSVVGPVSAVAATAVPVAVGVALGERPSVLAAAGVLVALPAIVLMAASGSMRGRLGAGLKDGLAAGVAFGLLFVGLAQAGRHDGLWPVMAAQVSELLVILVVAVKSREALRVPVRAAGLPVLAGVSGMTATLLYFYATHVSLMATAAVIVSLYPAVTVLGARVILHERFSPVQRAGLGLCALAVIAIALN